MTEVNKDVLKQYSQALAKDFEMVAEEELVKRTTFRLYKHGKLIDEKVISVSVDSKPIKVDWGFHFDTDSGIKDELDSNVDVAKVFCHAVQFSDKCINRMSGKPRADGVEPWVFDNAPELAGFYRYHGSLGQVEYYLYDHERKQYMHMFWRESATGRQQLWRPATFEQVMTIRPLYKDQEYFGILRTVRNRAPKDATSFYHTETGGWVYVKYENGVYYTCHNNSPSLQFFRSDDVDGTKLMPL